MSAGEKVMSSRVTTRTVVAASFFLIVATAGAADDAEQALRHFFEGRYVTVLIDMPASQAGVDVYPEREYPLDYGKASSRIGHSGVSVRPGQRIVVTKVRVKDDLIELHLGGGGWSDFKNGSGSVPVRTTPRTSRERELERRLEHETDPAERRHLRRELDHLRREREYRDEQNRATAEMVNAQRREMDRQRALDMGSRFNIRFDKTDVPEAFLTPEGVVRALQQYVDFGSLAPRSPDGPEDLAPDEAEAPAPAARKGMTREEIEAAYGQPRRENESLEGQLTVVVAAYEMEDERVEVTYVDDVAVRIAPLPPR
jgi:hypothetical protein